MSIYSKYIGIPYVIRGRTIKGLDCWGLPILLYRELFGVELLDFDNYEQDWCQAGGNYFLENYHNYFEQIETPEKNCLIFFTPRGIKDKVNHCGVYTGTGKFIQATKIGVIVSRISVWQSRVYGYYRLKK